MSSLDLVLKHSCEACGRLTDLYGSGCKHKTLCPSCGKKMAERRVACNVCGLPITKLIRDQKFGTPRKLVVACDVFVVKFLYMQRLMIKYVSKVPRMTFALFKAFGKEEIDGFYWCNR